MIRETFEGSGKGENEAVSDKKTIDEPAITMWSQILSKYN
jgi:hypothetical protein